LVEVSVLDRLEAGTHILLLGYSYMTNQYGLTVDNVAGYELVLPNGTIINVTSDDDDLWFGLRVSRRDQYRTTSLRDLNCREG
jgi:FAD/FMN-containing dehydrogenase